MKTRHSTTLMTLVIRIWRMTTLSCLNHISLWFWLREGFVCDVDSIELSTAYRAGRWWFYSSLQWVSPSTTIHDIDGDRNVARLCDTQTWAFGYSRRIMNRSQLSQNGFEENYTIRLVVTFARQQLSWIFMWLLVRCGHTHDPLSTRINELFVIIEIAWLDIPPEVFRSLVESRPTYCTSAC